MHVHRLDLALVALGGDLGREVDNAVGPSLLEARGEPG